MAFAWRRAHRRRWIVRVQDDPAGVVSADTIPQHIHVELQTADGSYHAGEWRFSDDPWSRRPSAPIRSAPERLDRYGQLNVSEAGHTIEVKMRVNPDRAFS